LRLDDFERRDWVGGVGEGVETSQQEGQQEAEHDNFAENTGTRSRKREDIRKRGGKT